MHAIARRDITRLIINVPPGAFKSTIANQAFSAWMHGREPNLRLRCVSHSYDLSRLNNRKTREIILSPTFKRVFPDVILRKNTEEMFETMQGGFKAADSAGGKVTGGNADGLITDDLLDYRQVKSKAEIEKVNDWYENAFKTRLRPHPDVAGFEIVIMQRLHDKDLTGYLLGDVRNRYEHCIIKAWEEEPKTYVFFNKKKGEEVAYERPHKYFSEQLKEVILEAKELQPVKFATQYQQDPAIEGGNLIKEVWLKFEPEYILKGRTYEKIVVSIDTASKPGVSNDYTAMLVFGIFEGSGYLIDVIHKKLDFPSLKREFVFICEKYACEAVLIEDKGSGTSLIQEAKRGIQGKHYNVIAISPRSDKEVRLISASDFIASGRLVIPLDAEFSLAFKDELLRFPRAEHDDMVDATSQFINWFIARPKTVPPCNVFRIRTL